MRWGKWVPWLAAVGVVCTAAEASEPEAPPAAAPHASEGGRSEGKNFKNLKVFPSDIGKKELITAMHSMNDALGVKCGFCHVMEPKKDFAADTDHKEAARSMLRMTAQINKELFTWKKAPQATCFMCHHGNEKPEMMPATPSTPPAH